MSTSNHYYSYLNSAEQILAHYEGTSPFSDYLKAFFRSNKKFGSRDRKIITQLCFSFFRMGRSLHELALKDQIITGFFFCVTTKTDLLETLRPEWNEHAESSINNKIVILRELLPSFKVEDMFPELQELSEGIDTKAFLIAHFQQPDLFFRIRPGKTNSVFRKLKRAGMTYTAIDEYTVQLPNSTPLEKITALHEEVIIQDYSSQRTAAFLPPRSSLGKVVNIWDCCAGSGGKSIMAFDYYGGADLTVSDNRESILKNLKTRFTDSGIGHYRLFHADLSAANGKVESEIAIPDASFDLVIADVPCSGSGTWGRTPERMWFFEKEELDNYANLQQRIVGNILGKIKPGGFLLYITCSVYEKENNGVVNQLLSQSKLELVKKGLIEGYRQKSDTLFAALLTLPA
jgi:16S rRNA (cytosine967-C5)-methyltransferase